MRGVIAAAAAGATVAVAVYEGRRGHPMYFAREHLGPIADAAVGDRGVRDFLAAHPEVVAAVPCPGDRIDVDTPADLAALTRPAGTQPIRP
ncbi:NTP transferase domain-containing protein [Glycomyces sp. TRM65418]|uniref:NTP transferase domain-containing protein n=1 Tax=Glycomyces sp. TRM65418 TaxID=2867006 RepID=UPI001D15EE93|nr:NTP transferase domain-containing protein [Glycomyces sp. TRM65418]MCC3765711.1 NTP transferase domain-containing protein [Glycomyces sp. TRM65418]